ncbi:MAG: hypothetical protein A2340_13505 [Lentisphaerae bacterium RIFOXYB12_FULL_60_10]|nr:MAG: hypothetical protein A2340_13505 [Lentisphaerae bacterium RIFOXYB12_FULL_60_10]
MANERTLTVIAGMGLLCFITLGPFPADCRAGEDDWLRPLGPPPQAAPRRISGGEGVPPLPLPATPLRRSERKREPKPPTLIGKVMWGEKAMFTYGNGSTAEVADWNQCPGDLQQILRKSQWRFELPYAGEAFPLSEFSGEPEAMPVLLFNGSRTIKLDARQIAILRAYVLRGGMVVLDSIAGSPYFYAGARTITEAAFPECAIRTLPPDHPLYHMLADVDTVRYPKNLDSDKPFLEGVYVGSRVGILLSKYGLGCSWDDREVPLIQEAIYYDVESGNKIGINLVAYAVGYAAAGREEAKPELFGALDEQHPTDEFVFAQVEHEGAWNVHPGAASALLVQLRQSTALKVSLKRVSVKPGQDDLSGYSFLYLTGLDDFRLDESSRAALRGFLKHSGTLLINNGLGLRSFDAVARREIAALLPGARLVPLPPTHPLYTAVFKIDRSRYTPAVVKATPDITYPVLEGIEVDGDVRVIYSPYDIESAWLGCEYPLARAYEPYSGTQLGVNIMMYAATH